jgi:hypothetical protein
VDGCELAIGALKRKPGSGDIRPTRCGCLVLPSAGAPEGVKLGTGNQPFSIDGLLCSLNDDLAPTAGSPQEFKNQRGECMNLDPVVTNPDNYKVVFENDSVRVLDYTDQPGHKSTPHEHPDSVMYTLSSFKRRLISDSGQREVEMQAGLAGWLPAQKHSGENIGETETHVIFVELKG